MPRLTKKDTTNRLLNRWLAPRNEQLCKKALMQEAEGKKACTVSFLTFFNWIVISATLSYWSQRGAREPLQLLLNSKTITSLFSARFNYLLSVLRSHSGAKTRCSFLLAAGAA